MAAEMLSMTPARAAHLVSNLQSTPRRQAGDRREAERRQKRAHRMALAAAEREQEQNERAMKEDRGRQALFKLPHNRTDEDLRYIWGWLTKRKPLMRWFYSATKRSDASTRALCGALRLVTVPKDTIIYEQDDVPSSFFVVVSGGVDVLHREIKPSPSRPTSPIMENDLDSHLKRGSGAGAGSAAGAGAGAGAGVDSQSSSLSTTGAMGPLLRNSETKYGHHVVTLNAGQAFGECVRTDTTRNETVVAVGSRNKRKSKSKRAVSSRSLLGAASGSSGSLVSSSNTDTVVLQVPAHVYRECSAPHTMDLAFQKRLTALSQLHAFRAWPRRELAFMARWMRESTVQPGEHIAQLGDPVDTVYFLISGCIMAHVQHPNDASDTLAVEQMFAPTVFGIEDVLRRHAHWEIGARAHTTCLVATLPLELWKRLAMHSTAPYKRVTRKTMLMFKADRSVWYEVRTEGDADTLAIAYDFMLSVQVAWISCSACGLKGHTSDLCPRRRRGSANSRVLPPGQRGLVVNNRLKFQKGSSVSTQLYQMGQALMRRTMEEAAKAGEDWNLALKVRRKRWAHRAVAGVMKGLKVVRAWLARRRLRRESEANVLAAERARVEAVVASITHHPKRRRSTRLEAVQADGSGSGSGSPARRHSSPVNGGLQRRSSKHAVLQFEPIVSPSKSTARTGYGSEQLPTPATGATAITATPAGAGAGAKKDKPATRRSRLRRFASEDSALEQTVHGASTRRRSSHSHGWESDEDRVRRLLQSRRSHSFQSRASIASRQRRHTSHAIDPIPEHAAGKLPRIAFERSATTRMLPYVSRRRMRRKRKPAVPRQQSRSSNRITASTTSNVAAANATAAATAHLRAGAASAPSSDSLRSSQAAHRFAGAGIGSENDEQAMLRAHTPPGSSQASHQRAGVPLAGPRRHGRSKGGRSASTEPAYAHDNGANRTHFTPKGLVARALAQAAKLMRSPYTRAALKDVGNHATPTAAAAASHKRHPSSPTRKHLVPMPGRGTGAPSGIDGIAEATLKRSPIKRGSGKSMLTSPRSGIAMMPLTEVQHEDSPATTPAAHTGGKTAEEGETKAGAGTERAASPVFTGAGFNLTGSSFLMFVPKKEENSPRVKPMARMTIEEEGEGDDTTASERENSQPAAAANDQALSAAHTPPEPRPTKRPARRRTGALLRMQGNYARAAHRTRTGTGMSRRAIGSMRPPSPIHAAGTIVEEEEGEARVA